MKKKKFRTLLPQAVGHKVYFNVEKEEKNQKHGALVETIPHCF